MIREIPESTRNKATNASVLNHIKDLSAHSDLGEKFMFALAPLGDVQLYCPDPGQCRYVAACTMDCIFAFASGMNTLAFRLDRKFKARALASGALDMPDVGEDWVAFTLFRYDWPEADLTFWARKAYVAARETANLK